MEKEPEFAAVCIEISHEKVDRPFQYAIPEHLRGKIEAGMLVKIPFGRSDKIIEGYVLELQDKAVFDPDKTKEIIDIVDNSISAEGRMISLAAFIKRHYGSTMIAALKTVLPVKKTVKSISEKELTLKVDEKVRKELLKEAMIKHHSAKERLLDAFENVDALSYSFVIGKLNVSASTLRSLEKQDVIKITEFKTYRDPVNIRESEKDELILNDEQQSAFDIFMEDLRNKRAKTYLLFGVTGSGKTEVYMKMIEEVLKDGKEVIVLIPEIALTYQTVLRFYRRFGKMVSFIHSKLSAGERFDQFERAKKSEIKIMIGPRSALFTPFNNLGLIIMDEEHESSYKSDTPPKYHAREVAVELARMHDAPLVLGSATPSITAFSRVKSGKYTLLTLNKRYKERQLPEVEVVDLRDELKRGNKSIFSASLVRKLKEVKENGTQAMLFLNRRGYAGFISCRSCGYVAKCPHCDVSLTEHGRTKLVCHYCGYEEVRPQLCPECGSKYIAGFSAGTEQVEEKLKEILPGIRTIRMDADTVKKKGDHEKILSAFAEGEADVLIGTQMIVKGHDFSNVTLVGIIAADLSLFQGDYMANERTFNLLTQAIGRAGRGEKKGSAVLQTYRPDHYAIKCAVSQDYLSFYDEEYAYRKMCYYPPYSHMLAILLTGSDKGRLDSFSEKVKNVCVSDRSVRVIGPADASISRINDRFRKVIYIRSENEDDLIEAKDRVEALLKEMTDKGDKDHNTSTLTFDFDPMNAY